MRWTIPVEGQTRVVRRFALLPTRMKADMFSHLYVRREGQIALNEVVWLEPYFELQEYRDCINSWATRIRTQTPPSAWWVDACDSDCRC